jgi:alanine-synthesizing transaminase
LTLLADEIYLDVAYAGAVPPIGSLEPDAPVISLSGLSKGYLVPGWRTGWLAVGNGGRLQRVMGAITRLAEGRLCTVMPMQHAIAPALTGDRSHQQKFRDALRVRAELVHRRANAIPGMSCSMPTAAFYAMPRVELPSGKTDVEFVLELLHATGVLCVYGSGFGMPAGDGYFRVVFLADPSDLDAIFDKVAEFTRGFLGR